MRLRVSATLASIIAVTGGLITLLSLLTTVPDVFGVRAVSTALLRLVALTTGVMVLVGVLNLLLVHLRRVPRLRTDGVPSLVLVSAALGVIGVTVAERNGWRAGQVRLSDVLLNGVQAPVEAALAALLAFALVYGAARALRRGIRWQGVLFVVAVVAVLLSQAGALPTLPAFSADAALVGLPLADALALPAAAGARGVLLGVGLATLVAGVRLLFGQDRSYRE